MEKITSPANLNLRKVSRIRAGKDPERMLVEGTRLLSEALDSGVIFEMAFVTKKILSSHPELAARLSAVKMYEIEDRLMQKISDVKTPQGILAIAKIPRADFEKVQSLAALLLSIRDPGNFGTMIRAAEAAGCEAIYYSSDCADPYQAKVVRASMGSAFRVPLIESQNPYELLRVLRKTGVETYVLDSRSGKNLFETGFRFPCLLVVGSEAEGVPADLPAATPLRIPMKGKTESLNAAMAFAIAVFQIAGHGRAW